MQRLRHLVVVVPGIGGSVLSDPDGSPVWALRSRRLLGAVVRPERLDLGAADDLRATALVSSFTVLRGVTVVPGYERLSEHLRRSFRAPVVHTHVKGLPVPGTVDVLLFPYDFRRSVRSTAVDLADAVDAALGGVTQSARRRRVIVIAHSMGGLVARYWLGPLGGAHLCAALLTLGTPHRGAPKALDWLVNGASVGPVGLPRATRALRSWPSVHELLPQYPAVWDASARLAVEMTTLPDEVVARRPRLADHRTEFAIRATDGRRTHEDIAAAWAALPPDAVPVVPYFGRGHATPNRLELSAAGDLSIAAVDPEWRGNVGWRGDGTVPAVSAIPRELGETRTAWRGGSHRHGDFAGTSAVIDLLVSCAGEALPTRGADLTHRPWLGLDVEETVPAGEPVPVGVVVQPVGTTTHTVHVTVQDPARPSAAARVEPLHAGDGQWSACLPPLPPGRFRLTFEAQGVPGVGSLFARVDLVALSPEDVDDAAGQEEDDPDRTAG